MARVLTFAGSAREGSLNKRLARLGHALLQAQGAEASLIDLRDFPMPLYDGDLEAREGLPKPAMLFRAQLQAHDAFLIASPEYNSSIPAPLKNAIDWASRPVEGEKPLACFDGKVIGLAAASPGALGGLRGLVALRMLLGNIGAIVIPQQLAVPKADAQLPEPGGLALKDAGLHKGLESVVRALIETARRLKG